MLRSAVNKVREVCALRARCKAPRVRSGVEKRLRYAAADPKTLAVR